MLTAERPLSGELFAGVGGLERAVEEVFGTRAAFFAEVDPAPSKVLAHRYPGVPNLGDVTKIAWMTAPKVRVLSGGFPCTDVSLAGRRAGMSGTRSGLWSEFARAIDELRPDWVVIENVRGLLSTEAVGVVEQCPWCVGDDGGQPCLRALGAVLGDLAELGFDAEWCGVPASDVGAPHQRFRVFIVAWPSENTCGGGGGGRSSGSQSSGRDDASDGSDSGGDRGRGDRVLMPTPVRTDSEGSARHTTSTGASHSGTSLTDAVRLLPTPRASEGDKGGPNQRGSSGDLTMSSAVHQLLPTPVAQPSGNSPEEHLRKKPGRRVVTDLAIMAENDLILSGGALLPTPEAKLSDSGPDYARAGRTGSGGDDLIMTLWKLLPTPTTSNAQGNAENGRGELLLPGAAAGSEGGAWGKYQSAIDLWAGVMGRPAPAPVRMDGRGGKARLNPELTEWMMGWPFGWVTDAVIGLSRSEQLRACGNGVVPQQAAYALRILLSRPGVPEIEWELVA